MQKDIFARGFTELDDCLGVRNVREGAVGELTIASSKLIEPGLRDGLVVDHGAVGRFEVNDEGSSEIGLVRIDSGG